MADPQYLQRLSTYNNFPNINVTPFSLAQSGFIYVEHKDVIKCVQCEKEIPIKIEKNITLFQLHKELSPACELLPTHQIPQILQDKNYYDDTINLKNQASLENQYMAYAHCVNLNEEKKMEEEIKRINTIKTCIVCKIKMVETLFLPCRHVPMCEDCSPKSIECPLCKMRIMGTARVYL